MYREVMEGNNLRLPPPFGTIPVHFQEMIGMEFAESHDGGVDRWLRKRRFGPLDGEVAGLE